MALNECEDAGTCVLRRGELHERGGCLPARNSRVAVCRIFEFSPAARELELSSALSATPSLRNKGVRSTIELDTFADYAKYLHEITMPE